MRFQRFAPAAALAIASLSFAAVASPTFPAVAAGTPQLFERTATYPVYLNVPAGVDPAAETVAEISTVTPDGNTVIYTDAAGKRIGFLDISTPAAPQGLGTVSLAELGHADDQPTSVAAYGDYVLVVIDETGGDFPNPKGRVDVLRVSDRTRVASIDLGGQPDSIAISHDGKVAIAMENQRDENRADVNGGLPQFPGGFVQTLDLTVGAPSTWTPTPINFLDASGAPLPIVAAAGLVSPEDPEPEYVSINSKNQLAVTLQENNGVAIIDLNTKQITNVWSAGQATATNVDATKDGKISLTETVTASREPDAIGWVDDTHLATANEGDWKGGSRGWTVFSPSGEVLWDADGSFEQLAVEYGLYNDSRAGKKGTEPEGIAMATMNGVRYAFVASERSNFVAVYDMTNPASPKFVQTLFTTNGPEGILPIESRNMLVVSSETDDASVGVRASVNIFQIGATNDGQASIVSGPDANGMPIGWSALGALSADPADASRLYAASDIALKTSRIYSIASTASPAVIDRVIEVTNADGTPAKYDIEGLYARPDGGFWLASEGATGAENLIVRTDAAGKTLDTIALPAEVSAHIGKWGFEGITATTNAQGEEILYVAIQRPLWQDPTAKPLAALEGENTTRIGQYNTVTGTWNWIQYELEPTSVAGDWMGLSEITMLSDGRLAVIERDKLNGPNATAKRLYTVEVPDFGTGENQVIAAKKTLAFDALPVLQSTNGWTQEKLEGMTVRGDGQVCIVTDNDGLKDATGETVFRCIGTEAEVFGIEQPATATPAPTASATPSDTPAAVTPAAEEAAGNDLAGTGADLGVAAGIAAFALGLLGLGSIAARRRNA